MGLYITQNRLSDVEQSIIRRHQQVTPVDLNAIAKELGINVWESENLSPNVSGMLFKDPSFGGASGYSISVRAQDAYVRKRFTFAHEIAHYLLHRQQGADVISDDEFYRSGLSIAQETEANKLAADIIMPKHLIEAMIGAGIKDIAVLANSLAVSQSAMMIRLGIPIP